jgi:chromosome segregation ATPase
MAAKKTIKTQTKKQPKKKVTLELFYSDFKNHEKDFKNLDKKVESLDKKVESLDIKVESLDKKVEKLDKDVRSLNKNFKSHVGDFGEHVGDFEEGRSKLDEVSDKLDLHIVQQNSFNLKILDRFDLLEERMMTRFDQIMGIIDKTETENAMRDHQLDRHETMIKKVNNKVGLAHLN